ncbi:Alg9-like mannosyltransferase family-domain-containing protein [Amylocystis lapponica]|nr:Alg9-like mannosyltransferase family-domain-containing protein [Amylocystis lapponica]
MQRSSVLALLVRVSIALATQTFFQPDEYFQSLEVAHHLVFGYGHLTWEWLSSTPIRSILYPALNIPVYWALKVLGLDQTRLLIEGPKVLHGVFAAGTDIWLCELTRKIFGERYVGTTLFLSLTSLFHGLSLSRSISNSLETSLTTMGLSYFPWDPVLPIRRSDVRKMCLFAALACAIRPTNAVIWVFAFGLLLFRLHSSLHDAAFIGIQATITGVIALSVMFVLDSAYYGAATFTPLNFLRTNLSSVSHFYGIGSWHYYFSQAIPILCTTTLPFVLHGAWLSARSSTPTSTAVLGLISWTTGIYSLAAHKEWRFIHPLLPLLHILAAKSLVDSYHATTPAQQTPHARPRPRPRPRPRLPIRRSHLALLSLSLPALAYVATSHGRAQIAVMSYLRALPPARARTVGFLTPCHSTPWHAHLHRPALADAGRMWALGCEPPLAGQDARGYRDQTDVFYAAPAEYLRARFPRAVDPAFPPSPFPCSRPGAPASLHDGWRHEWPQNIVLFGALLEAPGVRGVLEAMGYEEVWGMERGWEGDPRRRGGVRVWQYNAPA